MAAQTQREWLIKLLEDRTMARASELRDAGISADGYCSRCRNRRRDLRWARTVSASGWRTRCRHDSGRSFKSRVERDNLHDLGTGLPRSHRLNATKGMNGYRCKELGTLSR